MTTTTTSTSTSTAIAVTEPVFSTQERLALAGFLAGYTGLTREAYALDLPVLFDEMVNYAAPRAFKRVTGDRHSFNDAGPRTGIHPSAAARDLQVRVSTSMTHSRCAAVCPGSPQSSCAMVLPEQTWPIPSRPATGPPAGSKQ